MYSQGVSDLLAMLIEPFQSRYVTQLSREKSMESPSGRNSIGAGFFQSSYGQHAVDDSAITAPGAPNMTSSAGIDSIGFDSSRESSGKRKMSAPPALSLSTGADSDFHMSKSELLERREEQKRAERQRKWQDMESQMRLMLESDQQEEEMAERQEQERLQRAVSNASSSSLPHNNSGGTSSIQLNPSASSSSIMGSAFGLLRNLPPLPPSPSNGAQQPPSSSSATSSYSMNNASNAHPPSLSLQPPPSNFNASMAAAFGMTQYSSAGSLTPPVPIANTTSSSPSATTSNKRMSKFLFPHNPASNKHHHSTSTVSGNGDMMSLKSRSDDAYDLHHHHHYHGYGMAAQQQRPSIVAGHAATTAPNSMSAYHYPTTVLPHGSSSALHHYHHSGMHAPAMSGGAANAALPMGGGGYSSNPPPRSRPLSTSSLHLPPLPGLLNYPTANTTMAAANNFVHLPPSSSTVTASSTSAANTNANTTPTIPTSNIASSSSSSISQVVQSVLKRTGSMRSQASQRTSSQVSLRSRHSSHYTVNSSHASSGLDLHVPSADEINMLIETMHSAVKAEQELFHQTMYLYGASGSDLLLLSSEDGDDDDNDEEEEDEDGGLDGDGLLSTGDDASSTVRPLSSATTSVSGTAAGPSSSRSKRTQQPSAAGDRDAHATTKTVRTPRGSSSQPPVPSHVQAGSPSHRQGRTTSAQPTAQAQPPHPSYATSPSRRHGSLSRAHPSATMGAGNNSAYNRSYISDLSMSSRYTQSSLEERGLIDPERGYPTAASPSTAPDMTVSSPRHHHHHHLHAHLYHPPHAVGPGSGLPPPLGGYANEESVVVASLPTIDGRHRGSGNAPTKEEEDHLLDIIVGLIPSPSTNVHKSYRGSPTARSRSNRLPLTQSTNTAVSSSVGGGGGSETASVASVSHQRPSLRSEVDAAAPDTDADLDSLASPTTITSETGGTTSPRPPSGMSLPPGVEEIPSHPSKRSTHRYLLGYVGASCTVLLRLSPTVSHAVLSACSSL